MDPLVTSREIRDVVSHIANNPGSDLTVERLGELAGMSPRDFTRIFAREIGMTPGKFVELSRLESARRYLEQSTMPVGEVTHACGYSTTHGMRLAFDRHSGGATIAAIVLGRHPEVADAALLVACGCGATQSLQPLDVTSGIRRDVTVRLLVGENDQVTPPDQSRRYAEMLRKRGVDAQLTVLPALGHNIMFTQPVFDEAARLLSNPD